MSNFERLGEEGTFRNELGESQLGRISSPILPLQMFVFANVAFALKAAPEKQEKLLVLRTPGRILQPLATSQGIPLSLLHL